jgi:hypothetical protein
LIARNREKANLAIYNLGETAIIFVLGTTDCARIEWPRRFQLDIVGASEAEVIFEQG